VRVLPCETGLDLSGLSLSSQSRIWYQDYLTYPVGSVLSQVTEYPYACGYQISYVPLLRVNPGQFDPLPKEVRWNPTSGEFYISKCASTDGADAECTNGTVPYEKFRDIVVRVILEDGSNSIFSDALSFGVVIENACKYDTISFTSSLSSIEYAINSEGAPFTPNGLPAFTQIYPLCPTSCVLTRDGGAPISGDIISGTGLSFAQNPQPVITVATNDLSWVGANIGLQVTCVSLESDADPTTPGRQNSGDTDSFVLSLTDACSLTDIYPAQPTSLSNIGSVYFTSEMPFTAATQNLNCNAPTYIRIVMCRIGGRH
jgi:hypothetical protein